ncbi:hypothetical protein Tco_0298006, partial [Tanacetum coccineum]
MTQDIEGRVDVHIFSRIGFDVEEDTITLLKRIRKFSVAQDIGARADVHIFSMVSFAIVRGVGAQMIDDDTIVEDTLVVRKVLELIMKDGPRCGLHLNVDKTEVFWPNDN